MARGINKVILIGNLGADPEVRYTPNGSAIANVRIATTDSWKDKQTGEKQERTEWHHVVFFNRLAEIVGEYLRKGSKAYIEGSLRTRKWQDNNGMDRYKTEIIANEMQMLDSRSAQSDHHNYQQGSDQQPTTNYNRPVTHANPTSNAAAPAAAASTATAVAADEFDDDIPF